MTKLKSNRAGTTAIGSPFLPDADGFAQFFVAGGAYRITVTKASFTSTLRYVASGTAAECDVEDLALLAGKRWLFSTETGAADPGDGMLRFDHATLGSITAILSSVGGGFAEFYLTAVADSTGFRTLTVMPIAGTVPADKTELVATFAARGDTSTGAAGTPLVGTIFTPGGDGELSIYYSAVSHIQNPRTATIDSVVSDMITLTAAVADQFFDDAHMAGVAYMRIWNTSKAPDEAAWVTASGSTSTLTVTDAADIVGWAYGETVQIGDPTGETPNRVMALDISPMLQSLFGTVLRQPGILCKVTVPAGVAGSTLGMTPSGVTGSFVKLRGRPSPRRNRARLARIPCTSTGCCVVRIERSRAAWNPIHRGVRRRTAVDRRRPLFRVRPRIDRTRTAARAMSPAPRMSSPTGDTAAQHISVRSDRSCWM